MNTYLFSNRQLGRAAENQLAHGNSQAPTGDLASVHTNRE